MFDGGEVGLDEIVDLVGDFVGAEEVEGGVDADFDVDEDAVAEEAGFDLVD